MSETQNYCMVNQENLCDNVVLWDGNMDQWTPPPGYTMLVQATTPTKDWVWDEATKTWVFGSTEIGNGGIGFTWDGTYLIQPEPPIPTAENPQPLSSGTQTL